MEAIQENAGNPAATSVPNPEGTQYDHSEKPRVVVTAPPSVAAAQNAPTSSPPLGDPAPLEPTDPNALPTESDKWAWDENTEGVGEKPEWLDPKYKTVAEQAKAYKEAQSQLGKRQGETPPEEYEVTVDKAVKEAGFEPALESPIFKEFEAYARKNNYSQEHFNAIANFHLRALVEMKRPLTDAERTVYDEEQLDKMGNGGAQVIERVKQWGRAHCTEEQIKWYRAHFDSAVDISMMKEVFLDKMTQTPAAVTASPVPQLTRDDLKEMKRKPEYEYDLGLQKRVEDGYIALAQAGTLGHRAGGFTR